MCSCRFRIQKKKVAALRQRPSSCGGEDPNRKRLDVYRDADWLQFEFCNAAAPGNGRRYFNRFVWFIYHLKVFLFYFIFIQIFSPQRKVRRLGMLTQLVEKAQSLNLLESCFRGKLERFPLGGIKCQDPLVKGPPKFRAASTTFVWRVLYQVLYSRCCTVTRVGAPKVVLRTCLSLPPGSPCPASLRSTYPTLWRVRPISWQRDSCLSYPKPRGYDTLASLDSR